MTALRFNPKTLVAAFFMVAALGALAAPAAQALPEVKLQGGGEAFLDGEQLGTHIFKAGPREFTCTKAVFKGTTVNGANNVTVTPEYAECHTPVLGITFPVTVTPNGCGYNFTLKGKPGAYTAEVDVECETNKFIEVHVYSSHANHTAGTSTCTLKIGTQNGLKTNTLINRANGAGENDDDVEVNTAITGITYTVTPVNVTCGESGNNATYSGNSTLRATRPAGTFIGGSIINE